MRCKTTEGRSEQSWTFQKSSYGCAGEGFLGPRNPSFDLQVTPELACYFWPADLGVRSG